MKIIYLDNVGRDHFAWAAPRCMKVNHHELRSGGWKLGLEIGHVRAFVNHGGGLERTEICEVGKWYHCPAHVYVLAFENEWVIVQCTVCERVRVFISCVYLTQLSSWWFSLATATPDNTLRDSPGAVTLSAMNNVHWNSLDTWPSKWKDETIGQKCSQIRWCFWHQRKNGWDYSTQWIT